MANESTRAEISLSDINDETSTSSDNQQDRPLNVAAAKNSIKQYVTNVLSKLENDVEHQTNLAETQIEFDTPKNSYRVYENVSAFRQYHSHAEATARTDAYRRQEDMTSDDDLNGHSLSEDRSTNRHESTTELNLDPNPIIQERESAEKIYKQKVYLRQLQPPTPQPIEIQVQEVLLQPQTQKPPIHIRVGQREPRTPSPIIIKSTPPQPPFTDSDQPVIYNKYVPPPKQAPQQIIIHRYADLPPKPRPIVVEQWLPFKPAPKRIIKHSLPREAVQTPQPPHNILVSYGKPRTLVEVELVRLPVVKIDPHTYQQMSAVGQQKLTQHPSFQHEQDYLSGDKLVHASRTSNPINWRI
ncbi:unnamed protein product [Rotaria magnacalcarata]|uniref:Uncharacterized protein n=1 Tax=Rotaria magnacalcarata TaxID=392030 RepID=A0A814PDX8_9BILA|nr:unnamed protein product [Rotaria magnacalcarata]CAF1532291.1 unnamed protein product [Rotaria magnacalcarata]CAF2223683.1 unnamed protein product [Rotaria magnacalcarata]CAF3942202.1 unnamed protein product [Rotaria magnacalcarata]CAF3995621.1 unnamed protein product [Rotaria magnacalcarata]